MFHVHGHLVVVVAAGRRRPAKQHLEAAGRRAKAPGGQVHGRFLVLGAGAARVRRGDLFGLQVVHCRWPLRAGGAPGVALA